MPPVAAAISTWAAENAIAFFFIKTIAGIAVSQLASKLLTPHTKSPSGAGSVTDQSQTLTSLDPAANWEVVYGEVVKGGKIAFRHTTDRIGSDALSMESHVIPSTAPFTITLDAAATFVSDGGLVRTNIFDSTGDGQYITADLALTAGTPAAGEYAIAAGTYTFNEADAGKPVEIQFYNSFVADAHALLHLVIVLAAHEVQEIGAIYFNGEEVPLDADGNATGRYAGTARVRKHLGTADQEADALLIAEAPDKWTANHRGRGQAYIYVRLTKNGDLYPSVPNITARVKGRKVYDPRTDTTFYTNNWALCLADYLSHPVWGLKAAYGTEIDEDLLGAAAAISEEAIALAGGGTEPRYLMNGVVDTSLNPQDIIEKMLTAGSGRLVYIGGTWRIHAGAYITPTVTLDESDARGSIKVQSRLSRRDSFNRVKGIYISEANDWQPSDFPPVTNATYLSEDQGEEVWFDMELPFTTSAPAAQRHAKIELERVRQQITVTYQAKLSAYKIEPPETMLLTNAKFGWSAKAFEVLESRLVVDQDDQGNPILGVDLTLRETASTVYDWNSGEETTVDPAPDTLLPDPRVIAPPGVPMVTEELYETSDASGVHSKAIVIWGPAPAAQAWRYEHQYKLKDAVAWTPRNGLINGTRDEVSDLPPGRYMFRVQTVSVLGVRSTWSQAEYEIVGLTAAPSNVSGFSVQSYAEQAKFVWDRATDLDVRNGGQVVIRWSAFTVGATWNAAELLHGVDNGFPGNDTSGVGPLQTGTYLAKFRDSSGHYSPTPASFVITEALLRTLSSLAFVDFHPSFTGTLTNTVVTGGVLQLDSTTLWDDMTGTVDSWGLLDYLGGIQPTGSALFDDKLDLGSVESVRLFTTIESEAFFTGDVWDSRFGNVDDWGLVDGDVIEDANVELMVRVTDDDPNGTPTWGPWHPLRLVGDYVARGFEFRADFISGDATHNRRISTLTVTAKQ